MRGVCKIYDEPESLNEGARLRDMMTRNRQMRGVFKVDVEPQSLNEGGARKTCDEPDQPNEEACLRYMMNRTCKMICMGFVLVVRVIPSQVSLGYRQTTGRAVSTRNRQRGGVCKMCHEPESPNEEVCLRFMMNRICKLVSVCFVLVSCSCFCYVIAKRGGVFKIDDEPESAIVAESPNSNEGACFRYMIERNRQMRGRVVGIWRSGIAKEGTV